MAKKYECDRCGKQEAAGVLGAPSDWESWSPVFENSEDELVAKRTPKDLCGRCVRDLKEFLKRLPGAG